MAAMVAGCDPVGIEDALDWTACDDLMCATLPADGVQGGLAVVWHPAPDPVDDVVLLAAGGPGGSSTQLLGFRAGPWAESDPELFTLEWVAMDQRGTGNSEPMDCVGSDWFDDLRQLSPVPRDAAERAALIASRDAFQAGCLDRHGAAFLQTLSTPHAAADLDLLRDALSQDTISYTGGSYGTWLGAVYAHQFPDRVDRFVLDAVMHPGATRDVFLRLQAEGFERALERFFERCAADDECVLSDPAGTYDALLFGAKQAPLPAPTDPRGRTLTANELRWAATTLLYSPNDKTLASALAAAAAGDAAELLAVADAGWGWSESGYSVTLQGYWAIGCVDQPWPGGWTDADVFAFGDALEADFPRLGNMLITGELTCLDWPVSEPLYSVANAQGPPMLLVAGRHDPATPWQGTVDLFDALDNHSYLLTWEGDGHGALFRTSCTYEAMTGFLFDGAPPPVDSCPAP